MRQLIAILAVLAGLTISGRAHAQYPYPYNVNPSPAQTNQFQRQPVLSPYLNLNNRGNPAVNYFNFVQPQLQLNQFGGGFQGPPTQALQPGDNVSLDATDPTTRAPRSSAHPTTFNNTGSYFNSLGTIGLGTGRQGPQSQPLAGRRR